MEEKCFQYDLGSLINWPGVCIAAVPLSVLSYSSTVAEVLSTDDASSLSQQCSNAYRDEARTKTTSMLTQISAAIDQSGCNNTVTSITHVESFNAFGNTVSSDSLFTSSVTE